MVLKEKCRGDTVLPVSEAICIHTCIQLSIDLYCHAEGDLDLHADLFSRCNDLQW